MNQNLQLQLASQADKIELHVSCPLEMILNVPQETEKLIHQD